MLLGWKEGLDTHTFHNPGTPMVVTAVGDVRLLKTTSQGKKLVTI